MKLTLSIFLTIIFFGLAVIHFYWAFGGQWGFDYAIPTNEQGVQVLNPKTIESIIVGLALLLFGIFYLLTLDFLKYSFPDRLQNIAFWTIPIIFTLRTIGDFKYIGFFKQIKTTEFANLDTLFYLPLSVTISLIGFILIRLKK